MLLHYFSDDYFDRTDYLLSKPNTESSLEFELITLVSSQKSKPNHWAGKWCLNDPELMKEIHEIAEMTEGVILSKESVSGFVSVECQAHILFPCA